MRFEKVTFVAFRKDMLKYRFREEEIYSAYENIKLPYRTTRYSAGYDFVTPVDFCLSPGHRIVIPTGIKVYFSPEEIHFYHLSLYMRSSIGINQQIIMSNGTGVIDADYYNNPDNEGDMLIALTNIGDFYRRFKAGDRLIQGIFELHGLVEGDAATNARMGGVGSTGENNGKCTSNMCGVR